jgi:hypothetical protein
MRMLVRSRGRVNPMLGGESRESRSADPGALRSYRAPVPFHSLGPGFASFVPVPTTVHPVEQTVISTERTLFPGSLQERLRGIARLLLLGVRADAAEMGRSGSGTEYRHGILASRGGVDGLGRRACSGSGVPGAEGVDRDLVRSLCRSASCCSGEMHCRGS